MNRKKKFLVITISWLPLIIVGFLFLYLLIIFNNLKTAKILTDKNNIFFKDVTNLLYFNYFRPQWQGNKECSAFDEVLIYKPRQGKALFESVEFSTEISIDKAGYRKQSNLQITKKPQILIIGDSHAFGWGVNDRETFASILNNKYGFNTKNASCPSYETVREILYAIKINAIQSSDIILFCYCNNDAVPNRKIIAHGNLRGVPYVAADWWKGPGAYRQLELSFKNVVKAFFSLAREYKSPFQFFKRLFEVHYRFGGKDNLEGIDGIKSAEDFLFIVNSFEELKDKQILFCEINGKNANSETFNTLINFKNCFPIKGFIKTEFRETDYFIFDDHINTRGHEKVAKAIAAFLNQYLKEKK